MYYINEEVAAAAAAATAASAGQRFSKNTNSLTSPKENSHMPPTSKIYSMTYFGVGIPSKGPTWKVLSNALLFRVAQI